MKISILTYYENSNYGSALQMYALTRYLESLGHDVVIFDFLNLNSSKFRRLRIVTVIDRLIGLLKAPAFFNYRKLAKQEKLFQETLLNYKNFYHKEFNYFSQFYHDFDEIDMYIAGSDQVWNLQVPNLHYVFFMRFINENKRMSYAASFGSSIIPDYNFKRLRRYISSIKYISVREETGKDIVKEVSGKAVECVLDPVLLVGREFWESKIVNSKFQDKEYTFCYFLDYSELADNLIKKICNKNSSTELVCADTGVKFSNCKIEVLTPFEFVAAIRNAKYILTDSFHAVAFSLLFNKVFYVCARNYRSRTEQADRIKSILKMTGTVKQYIVSVNEIDKILLSKIYDIQKVNEYLERKREKSIEYLTTALS